MTLAAATRTWLCGAHSPYNILLCDLIRTLACGICTYALCIVKKKKKRKAKSIQDEVGKNIFFAELLYFFELNAEHRWCVSYIFLTPTFPPFFS
jgi:hypothetical protein